MKKTKVYWMGDTHDVTISGFDLSNLEAELKAKSERIIELEAQLALLKEILGEQISKQPKPWVTPPQDIPNACAKCGLHLDTVMHYVCSDAECPSGLGPIMCHGNT